MQCQKTLSLAGLVLAQLVFVPAAQAGIFKCINSEGQISYQAAACDEDDVAEPIKIKGALGSSDTPPTSSSSNDSDSSEGRKSRDKSESRDSSGSDKNSESSDEAKSPELEEAKPEQAKPEQAKPEQAKSAGSNYQ